MMSAAANLAVFAPLDAFVSVGEGQGRGGALRRRAACPPRRRVCPPGGSMTQTTKRPGRVLPHRRLLFPAVPAQSPAKRPNDALSWGMQWRVRATWNRRRPQEPPQEGPQKDSPPFRAFRAFCVFAPLGATPRSRGAGGREDLPRREARSWSSPRAVVLLRWLCRRYAAPPTPPERRLVPDGARGHRTALGRSAGLNDVGCVGRRGEAVGRTRAPPRA